MAGNTFGELFRVTTWGESHGPGIGVVVDGCPPGLALDEAVVQKMLDRRKPGGGSIASTARKEADRAVILSGVFEGKTTGTPILIMAHNRDARSSAYTDIADLFRPGHGDITYTAKYGIRDWRGGGRASARETFGRVAAGAVAAELLRLSGVSVAAYTLELGGIRATTIDVGQVDQNMFGCPDSTVVAAMTDRVTQVKRRGDSVGGIVEVRADGVPAGLGEPVFDKLDADIAKALMSIGAVKGVELGAGFEAPGMTGEQHNDEITPQGFVTNNAGGILAGISNGDRIVARAAVKPIPSIGITQKTVDTSGKSAAISIKGRHDVSAIPRINVVCEAMICLVLADHLLRQKAISWMR